MLLGLARYDGDSRRDKATVVRLATTFLKAQQVPLQWQLSTKKNNASPSISQSKTQVLRALCKNKEAREAFGVTQAKPEGALVVVTEDMEVLFYTDWLEEI